MINGLLGALAALIVATMAWQGKESASAHTADIVNVSRSIDSLRAEFREGQTRILDAICHANDSKRVCK